MCAAAHTLCSFAPVPQQLNVLEVCGFTVITEQQVSVGLVEECGEGWYLESHTSFTDSVVQKVHLCVAIREATGA